MAQTSELFQWFILRQSFHLLLHAGHSSFFRTRDCEQNLHLSSRSSVFFSSNEASVHSPCLRFFLERSLPLRCTRWTLRVFHQTPGGESSRSPLLGIYQHLSSGRAFFLEITVPWHLHSEYRERYGLEVESRSLLGSYRSYKIPPCFSRRWDKCQSFHQLLGSSG